MGCVKSSPVRTVDSKSKKQCAVRSCSAAESSSPAIISRKCNTNTSKSQKQQQSHDVTVNKTHHDGDDDENDDDAESVDSRQISKNQATMMMKRGNSSKQQQQSQQQQLVLQSTSQPSSLHLKQGSTNTRAGTSNTSPTKQNQLTENMTANAAGVIEDHHLADENDENKLKLQMRQATHRYTNALIPAEFPPQKREEEKNVNKYSNQNAEPVVAFQSEELHESQQQQEGENKYSEVENQRNYLTKGTTITTSQLGLQMNSQKIDEHTTAAPSTAIGDSIFTNASLRQPASLSQQQLYTQKSGGSITMKQTAGQRLSNSNIVTSGLDYEQKRRELLRKFSDEIEELDEMDENTYQIGGNQVQAGQSTASRPNEVFKKVNTQFIQSNLQSPRQNVDKSGNLIAQNDDDDEF